MQALSAMTFYSVEGACALVAALCGTMVYRHRARGTAIWWLVGALFALGAMVFVFLLEVRLTGGV